jgi:TRAP-type C4-dicarboxylate transport system permease small subunit
MVLVVSYTCFTRYVLSFTPAWGEELALMCMVWFGFMAIALGVRDDGHIGVTLFDKFYPPPLLWLLNLFKYLAVMAFGYFMTVEGYRMALVGAWNKLPGLGLSSYYMYIIVTASGVAIIVYCLQKLVEHILNRKNDTLLEGEDA